MSTSLGSGVILNLNSYEKEIQTKMMFSVCLASFLFIISSSLFGMPISGTHTVVGALLGTGLAVENGVLNWSRLAGILLSWVISPCSAAIMSFILYLFVLKLDI